MAKQPKVKKPYRVMHKFWLDLNRENEFWLDEQIATLKARRSFVTTIRQAIELILDLRAGRLDVLFSLFPWTQDTLKPAPTPPDNSDLERKIEQLERVILQQGIPTNAPLVASPALKPTGMQPIAGASRKFDLPTFDDDDDDGATLVIKKSTSTDASMNFLTQLQGFIVTAATPAD